LTPILAVFPPVYRPLHQALFPTFRTSGDQFPGNLLVVDQRP
jgi:hypothetical protein